MRRRPTCLAPMLLLALVSTIVSVPFAHAQRTTDHAALEALGRQFRAQMEARESALYRQLVARTEGPQGRLNRNPDMRLMFVDSRGVPRFYTTTNLNAARTVNTDDVWPGGSTPHTLSGASTLMGELGEWDGGGVRTTHQELVGRVTQMNVPAGLSSHSTHVAGTLIASGASPTAKGMSYEGVLAAYEWTDDNIEMAAAAAGGMLVSNHSYGYATGWLFNLDGSGRWFWFGDTTVSATEDYGFGYYGETAEAWDQIAFDAPNYLIVKSAGNDRNDFGPAQPDSHYVWDTGADDWVFSMTVRDADGGPGGYDSMPWFSVAKNILTVAAVNDISAGWTSAASVVMTSFSGWGPCDDGRIKPDISANGASLTSCTSASNTSYGSSSGTSMASPNTAGSVNLLIQHYEAEHAGTTPRSATMKAVLLHTANEAGLTDGPDYRYGWGLLNTSGAADLIKADTANFIRERTLATGSTDEFVLQHSGGDLRVTMAWTDPAGTPVAAQADAPDAMLVNDLDLRVEEVATTTTHLPWVLDPDNPADPATTGDNARDNVEQVFVAAAPAGEYRVAVGHKSVLANAAQDYSIVGSGELDSPPSVSVESGATPARFSFAGVYPNPFSTGTRIEFVLPSSGKVQLGVYDLSGRRVRGLGDAQHEAGRHSVHWDGRGGSGDRLPAGIYFVRASTPEVTRMTRLVLLD